MADRFLNSANGSPSANYTTEATAATTLATIGGVDTAGDVIYVKDSHAESTGSAQTYSGAGTAASPIKILSTTWTGDNSPNTLNAGASVATSGAFALTLNGSHYCYGITFTAGSGAVNANIVLASLGAEFQYYENCVFVLGATGSNCNINIGALTNTAPSRIIFDDCDITFNTATNEITGLMGDFTWNGGVLNSTSGVNNLFNLNGSGEAFRAVVDGVDLSAGGSSMNLVTVTSAAYANVTFRNCKLPSSWSGVPMTGTTTPGDRVEVFNCDSGDTNYKVYISDYFGSIVEETSIYNDAGADDGSGQPFSWKMTADANCEFPHQVLRSPEIMKWNDTVTGTLTATVEIVHNSQGSGTNGALRDDEIWLEVMYLGTSGVPLGSWISDRCANLNLNSDAADQASSTATWTGDSAGWDTQKLSVSFDPKEKGYIVARVKLAKASAVVYVDPLLTVA